MLFREQFNRFCGYAAILVDEIYWRNDHQIISRSDDMNLAVDVYPR